MTPPPRYVDQGVSARVAAHLHSDKTFPPRPVPWNAFAGPTKRASRHTPTTVGCPRMRSVWNVPCSSPEDMREIDFPHVPPLPLRQEWPLLVTTLRQLIPHQVPQSLSRSPMIHDDEIGSDDGITSGVVPEITPTNTLRDGRPRLREIRRQAEDKPAVD
jgi:hypothetical protein